MKSLSNTLSAARKLESGLLQLNGFKVLLAWHYIVVFSPLLIGALGEGGAELFYWQLLALYLSIAGTFIALTVVGERLMRAAEKNPISIFLIVGVVATISTALTALFAYQVIDDVLVLRVSSSILLGSSKSVLMYFWLFIYGKLKIQNFHRSLAVDMIIGTLLGFLACSLLPPLNYVLIVVMPIFATFSLGTSWLTMMKKKKKKAEVDPPRLRDKKAFLQALQVLLPSAVFAFIFGLLQGSFYADDRPFLLSSNPVVLLGIAIAGICIFVIPKDKLIRFGFDLIQRFAMMFFALGVIGLSFIDMFGIGIASQAAILAGFNLFYNGVLAVNITIGKQPQTGSNLFIEFGRSFVYLGFAFGLFIGINQVFSLPQVGAGGTLGSVFDFAIILLLIALLVPYNYLFDNKKELRGSMIEGSSVKQEASLMVHGEARLATDQASYLIVSGNGDSSSFSRPKGMPHKNLVNEVARVYQLSPRETEVLHLIAKGRNAEYIKSALVISHHTAKTHIANIYRKLEVHSSQEMLNLIDSFREIEA